jgi:hypothetical protein
MNVDSVDYEAAAEQHLRFKLLNCQGYISLGIDLIGYQVLHLVEEICVFQLRISKPRKEGRKITVWM